MSLRNPTDRTVHAHCDDYDVVRYDRSGKWYIEPTPEFLERTPKTYVAAQRKHVGVVTAAEEAMRGLRDLNGVVFPDLPGGAAFDRAVRATADFLRYQDEFAAALATFARKRP